MGNTQSNFCPPGPNQDIIEKSADLSAWIEKNKQIPPPKRPHPDPKVLWGTYGPIEIGKFPGGCVKTCPRWERKKRWAHEHVKTLPFKPPPPHEKGSCIKTLPYKPPPPHKKGMDIKTLPCTLREQKDMKERMRTCRGGWGVPEKDFASKVVLNSGC